MNQSEKKMMKGFTALITEVLTDQRVHNAAVTFVEALLSERKARPEKKSIKKGDYIDFVEVKK
jgi:hypothetical protein